MRIVFIGSVRFSRRCLDAVAAAGGRVAAVLSPNLESARVNSDYEDLEPAARRHGFPFRRIGRIGEPETVDFVRSLAPDVIFVFGFSQLLPPEILAIPRLGAVGTHPALLPRDRGRHPLVWALADGLAESGLTFFFLDERADGGDILWQKSFPIGVEDDAESLYRKIEALAEEAIPAFLPQLASGRPPRRRQDESRATVRRKRTEADGEIDWPGPGMKAYNLIRALARPYAGAHTFVGSRRMKVWRGEPPREDVPGKAVPGEVMALAGGGALVKTGDGALRLTEWELEPGPALAVGDRLGRRTS